MNNNNNNNNNTQRNNNVVRIYLESRVDYIIWQTDWSITICNNKVLKYSIKTKCILHKRLDKSHEISFMEIMNSKIFKKKKKRERI